MKERNSVMRSLRRLIRNSSVRFLFNAAPLVLLLFLTLGLSAAWAARDNVPPTKPTNFRETAKTAYSLSLAWGPSTDKSGNFVYILANTANSSLRVTLPMTATSFTFNTGLFPNRSYTFIIQAVDAAG